MFAWINGAQQARRAQKAAEALLATQRKLAADLDYMAMMCDVELEAEQEENQEGQNDEV